MAAGRKQLAGRKQSSDSSFLFVNKNASNLNSKAQAGVINAHSHAYARAAKKPASSSQPNASPASSKNSRLSGPSDPGTIPATSPIPAWRHLRQRRARRRIAGTSRAKDRDATDRTNSKLALSPLNPFQVLDNFLKFTVEITPYEKNLVKHCKSKSTSSPDSIVY
jgi:hypothetical protein